MVISEDIHVKYKGSPEYRKIYHLRHKLQQLAYNKKKVLDLSLIFIKISFSYFLHRVRYQ
jgi:hypothetical protein